VLSLRKYFHFSLGDFDTQYNGSIKEEHASTQDDAGVRRLRADFWWQRYLSFLW